MSNNPGYKHTLLGWIPEKWEIKRVGKITKTLAGGTPSTSVKEYWNGKIKWMSSGELNLKKVYNVEGRITEIGLRNSSTRLIPPRCILIGLAGQGKTRGTVAMNMIELCTNQSVAAILPSETFVGEYLYYNLDNRYDELRQLSTGDGGRGGLNLAIIKGLSVALPPLPEQHKIAAILSTWDECITNTQQLITYLQQRNKGLMQALLTGKKRVKGFAKPWKKIHLIEAFNERNETGFVNLDLLSLGSLGVYPQSQSDKRDTSNSDKAKYKRICPGDIGYNTMRMWQGRSALSSIEGIVSPAYTIVTPKEEQHSKFYAYLFKLPSVVNKFFRNSQGLVEDTLNCKFKDFSKVQVEVPDYEEQVAIDNVLTTAHAEIKSYEQKLNTLQQQKKGLMQKLLTGEVRVKIEE